MGTEPITLFRRYEHLIQQALSVLLARCTAFVIAHRLSTIRKVDRIYVTESGTNDELLAKEGGTYRCTPV